MHGTCQRKHPKTEILGLPNQILPTTSKHTSDKRRSSKGTNDMEPTEEEKIFVIINRLIHFKKELPYYSQQSSESVMPMPKSKKKKKVYVC
jgi:hypothetical protein